ncbi:MAG: hypothetical protein R3F48_06080 [Candidatus Zixiibacteriota bacterium]
MKYPLLLVSYLVFVVFISIPGECRGESCVLKDDDCPRETKYGSFVTYDWNFRFCYIIPNPFDMASGVFTRFELPESCSVSLKVLDSTLNTVYDYGILSLGQGCYIIMWNYENGNGEKIPPGHYYFDLYAKATGTATGVDLVDDFNGTGLLNEYRCRHGFYAVSSDYKSPPDKK